MNEGKSRIIATAHDFWESLLTYNLGAFLFMAIPSALIYGLISASYASNHMWMAQFYTSDPFARIYVDGLFFFIAVIFAFNWFRICYRGPPTANTILLVLIEWIWTTPKRFILFFAICVGLISACFLVLWLITHSLQYILPILYFKILQLPFIIFGFLSAISMRILIQPLPLLFSLCLFSIAVIIFPIFAKIALWLASTVCDQHEYPSSRHWRMISISGGRELGRKLFSFPFYCTLLAGAAYGLAYPFHPHLGRRVGPVDSSLQVFWFISEFLQAMLFLTATAIFIGLLSRAFHNECSSDGDAVSGP